MAATSTSSVEVRLVQLDERERDAWKRYGTSIQGLSGEEYEEMETSSWDRLQGTLGEVKAERARLADLVPVPDDD